QGLGGSYAQFFHKQFPDINVYEEKIRPVLELIQAAQDLLEVKTIATNLNWGDYDEKIFSQSVGALFPILDGRIQPFHKSIMEWLADDGKAGRYFINSQAGHKRLANQGWQEYKQKLSTMSRYMIAYLVTHLIKAECWDRVETILTDLSFIEIKCRD